MSGFVTLTMRVPTSSSTNGDGIARSIVKTCWRTRARSRLTLEPLDDFLVVQTPTRRPRRAPGLILPASAETQCSSGIVTAVGPDAEGVAPGDKVLFPKEAGYDVRLAGTAQRVLKRDELIARILD